MTNVIILVFEDSNERYDILILRLLQAFIYVYGQNFLDDCGTDLATDIMVGYCLETVPELAESSSINSYPSGINIYQD